ncbi:MAG: DNA-processing protein DprA [Candidatus Eremiobacteraeota bacterium]|nr:DNA-processing protein DprA [Candidatus Eremiobacteraeota bacterium]
MTAPLVLLAAALLRVPARRMRALALGDDGALRGWIANESATRLAEARRDARLAFARLEELGARIVPLGAPDYPAGLRDLKDPPAWLAVRGTLPRAHWREGTAIVGSRDADAMSLAAARTIVSRVAAPIVSGLARGVDTAAHEAALATGVATYAYVGTGLGIAFPPENRDLEDRIVAAGGCILSEMLPDEGVTRWSLVRRDRLQAAHAASLVLVQSEVTGGAMHAVRVARQLGRPRFAFAAREGDAFAGNALAIGEGAASLSWDFATAGGGLA